MYFKTNPQSISHMQNLKEIYFVIQNDYKDRTETGLQVTQLKSSEWIYHRKLTDIFS